MQPVERARWQSMQADARPESLMPPMKYASALTLFAEMPTANSERPAIQAPQSAPVLQVLEVFAAAYRDPAPANTRISWTMGLADVADPRLIEALANTEQPEKAEERQ